MSRQQLEIILWSLCYCSTVKAYTRCTTTFRKIQKGLTASLTKRLMIPLSVGLANSYVFHYHPIQHKDTSWTSGSQTLEIIIWRVYLNLFIWSNAWKVARKELGRGNVNPQYPVIEQEEFSLSSSKQPTMPTRQQEVLGMDQRLTLPALAQGASCPRSFCFTPAENFMLTFLTTSSSGTSRELLPDSGTGSCLLWVRHHMGKLESYQTSLAVDWITGSVYSCLCGIPAIIR